MNVVTPQRSLDALVNPSSVVIVGASGKVGHFANQPVSNLWRYGFSGSVFLVNPSHEEIDGVRCYDNVSNLPDVPDLAIIVVQPALAVEALGQCAAFGIRAAVIVASGFAESGVEERVVLQLRIKEICDQTGIRVCGPNTLGIANWTDRIVSFASGNIPPVPKVGNIAVVSQSGGLGFTIVNRAWSLDVGIGHLAVAGNEVDVSIPEFAQWYLERPDVQTVACYMESLRDIDGLRGLGERSVALNKPVFVLKAGRSERGQLAASAHTGALAASDDVCSAALKQWGLLRVDTLDGLINAAALAAHSSAPTSGGVGLYCQGGGMAVLTSDLFDSFEIELPEISSHTSASLAELLPDSSAANPLDSGGQFLSKGTAPLIEALGVFESDPAIGVVAVMAMPVLGDRAQTYASAIEQAAEVSKKPYVAIPYAAGELTGETIRRFREAGLVVLEPPAAGVEGLGAWLLSGRDRGTASSIRSEKSASSTAAKAQKLIAEWRGTGYTTIPEYEAIRLFQLYGIATPRQQLVFSAQEAMDVAKNFGTSVALKVASPDIPHRTDVGGISLNVRVEDVGAAFTDMMERMARDVLTAKILGISVVEMVAPGRELILGVNRDPSFGPVLLVGLGGIFAEVINDVVMRLPPIDRTDAAQMLAELKGASVLEGARGHSPIDIDAVSQVVARLSDLVNDVGNDINAIDLNPLFVYPNGTLPVAADALVELVPKRGPRLESNMFYG
jgi:acetyltransferase